MSHPIQVREGTRCCESYLCTDLFSIEELKEIHQEYWLNLSPPEKKMFLYHNINSAAPKRKKNDRIIERKTSRSYYLKNKRVCGKFFLMVLGYRCDAVITHIFKNGHEQVTPPADDRGKQPCNKKTTDKIKDAIVEHVNTYNPHVSHYRRENCPQRRYLPPDISVTKLYKTFIEKYEKCPEMKVKYEIFRREFHNLALKNVKGVCFRSNM